jgi:hypothetical protein
MKFLQAIKRVSLEITLLISIVAIVIYTPADWFLLDAKKGLLNLFLAKLLFVSAGFIHAHIGRKIAFPYMNLRLYIEDRNIAGAIFLTVWYIGIVYCWSHGG